MSLVWKVALGLVVALMLPVAAYAAGTLTAPSDSPAPRGDIVIDDSPSPATKTADPGGVTKAQKEAKKKAQERRRDRRDQKRDDRDDRGGVKVVTPKPMPVTNDGWDDDGDDDGDDEGDDGGDDDDDDGGDD